MSTLLSKYLNTNSLQRKASILHSSSMDFIKGGIPLWYPSMKWLSLPFYCNIWIRNVCWVHYQKEVDILCLMLITPQEKCVRGICHQTAAAMLHCYDCHLFRWHPTVNLTSHVFWDVTLCHLVSTDILTESRIPLLGPLKPWRRRHYIPSKNQETLTHWHSIISQNTWTLNSTTVRTECLLYTNVANKGFNVMWS